MARRLVFVFSAIALVAAACSSGGSNIEPAVVDTPLTIDALGEGTATSLATEALPLVELERGAPADNRLAVIDDSGNLVVVDPDGSNRAVIASADSALISQPVFSPDGTRLAWSERRGSVTDGPTFLMTANVDGSNTLEAETPFLPFYSYWDPTSSRIAFLGDTSGSVGLGLLEVATGVRQATPVDTGAPYYFSWDPDGSRLFARVANGLQIVQNTGAVERLGPVTAPFRVPIWAPGGDLYLPLGVGSAQILVSTDGLDGVITELLSFEGEIFTVLDPTGRRLAVQTTGGDPATADQVQDTPRVPAVMAGLDVLDLATGELTRVAEELMVAFFWSPDGDRLLMLALEEAAEGDLFLRWNIWHDGDLAAAERFTPSGLSANYIPFFEQYSQSISFWSPDATSFVYAGVNEAGDSGIFVQDAITVGPAELISGGILAIWSPT